MRLKMYSMYDHFPEHNYVVGKPYIACYNDFHVTDNLEDNAIALLIEPRSIQPDIYSWMEKNYYKFKIVFTHDSILLSCLPNAKLILWGGIYSWLNINSDKGKDISFCSSDKEMCIQHKKRKELCKLLENRIDCMGTYNGNGFVSTERIYKDYKFSIVIENYKDDFWFTEKICNAFANKCVPIYYGARNICDFFDKDGIIEINDLNNLPNIVDDLLCNIEYEYNHRISAIDYNFHKVKEFENFERWFLTDIIGSLKIYGENIKYNNSML